jgi:hypothetical protein
MEGCFLQISDDKWLVEILPHVPIILELMVTLGRTTGLVVLAVCFMAA